jgi:outer membrane protein OmpA-like peptidoglycan-associated protein
VAPPSIDELQVAAGQIPGISFPVPVIRLIFSEKVFFDFDRAEVKSEALPLLTLVAENMRRDLPDTQILILGHTDAIGSDKYNDELSQRRAQSVMTELIRRGVGSANMATVALGKPGGAERHGDRASPKPPRRVHDFGVPGRQHSPDREAARQRGLVEAHDRKA